MTRSIPISYKQAIAWYKSGNPAMQKLALQAYNVDELESRIRMFSSWDELIKEKSLDNAAIPCLKEDKEALTALAKLHALRQPYIEDWPPEWVNEPSYAVVSSKTMKGGIVIRTTRSRILSFPTVELANKFHTTFKDLILQAEPFL